MARRQGPPSRVSVEVRGLHARGHEPVGWLVVHKPRAPGARWVHHAPAIEAHRLDGMAHGDTPGLRVGRGRRVKDGGNPTGSEQAGYQAEMRQQVTMR